MTPHTIKLIRGSGHPALAGLVAGVVGIDEQAPAEVIRRQPAGDLLPLVFAWGDPLDIVSLSAGDGTGSYGSFVSGFMPGHVTTRFRHRQECVQVYLTPLGVHRILGVPGRELARRVVRLDEVAPSLGEGFADRLGSAPSWRERFALVGDAMLALASEGREPDDVVDWMWGQIEASGGRARVGDLVDRSGWSHRHVTTRFTEQVGLTPKAAIGVGALRERQRRPRPAAVGRGRCQARVRRPESPDPRGRAVRRRVAGCSGGCETSHGVHRTWCRARAGRVTSRRQALD